MTDTRTVGTTGADHVDLNAWVAWVQANRVSGGNLTDHQVAAVKAVGFSPTTSQIVSGWAPGGSNFTTTITANTGDSFRENASVQSNAYYFSTATGAFIDGSDASSPTVEVAVDKAMVSKLQIRCSGGSVDVPLRVSTTSPSSIVVDNCILDGTSDVGILDAPSISDNITVRNTLATQRRGAGGSSCLSLGVAAVPVGGGNFVHACTLNCDGGVIGINAGSYGVTEVKGTVMFGGVAFLYPISGRDANTTGSHNATNLATWDTPFGGGVLTGLTNSQMSLTASTEFQNPASDLRLKSGSAKCKDLSTAITGVTTDAAGTTRPSGSAEDIGAWEFVAAGGSLSVSGAQTVAAFANTDSIQVIGQLASAQAMPDFAQAAVLNAGAAQVAVAQTIPDFTQAALAAAIAALAAGQAIPDFGQSAAAVGVPALAAAQTIPAFANAAAATVTSHLAAAQTIPAFGNAGAFDTGTAPPASEWLQRARRRKRR